MIAATEYCYFCFKRTAVLVRPYICSACLSRLPFRRRSQAVQLGLFAAVRPAGVSASVICPFFYEQAIRDAILRMKFGGSWYPARALGPQLADAVVRSGIQAEAVVPLPLHANRLRQRGFNQAERLAAFMAPLLRMPVLTDLLHRSLDTPRQSEASDESARYRQVMSAFRVNDGLLPASVFLLDDVLTTGATMAAASAALAAAGIRVQPVVCASNRGKAKL